MLSSITRSTPTSRASTTWSSESHSTSMRRPGQRARARSTARVRPSTARWLSLMSTASDSESRWLNPPPARTAARCTCRKPGQRLARVEHARLPLGGAHVAARQRRDARTVAEEVERGALTGEDDPQRARYLAELHARLDRLAVAHVPLQRGVGVELGEDLGRERGAGEHAFVARDEGRDRGLVVADARERRDVAEHAEIFGQRLFNQRAQHGTGRVERGHECPPTASAGNATKTGTALERTTKRPRSASDVCG